MLLHIPKVIYFIYTVHWWPLRHLKEGHKISFNPTQERLAIELGSTSPTLLELWCIFFVSHKTSESALRRDLQFFVLI